MSPHRAAAQPRPKGPAAEGTQPGLGAGRRCQAPHLLTRLWCSPLPKNTPRTRRLFTAVSSASSKPDTLAPVSLKACARDGGHHEGSHRQQ